LAAQLCAPPIATDRVAWSVGLSVGLSPSEPCKNGWSDQDAVCVKDAGRGPRENLLHSADRFGRILHCADSTQYSLLLIMRLHRIWLRGTAVERRSLARELCRSCARPVADGYATTYVSKPFAIGQPTGRFSLSSLRGRCNWMSPTSVRGGAIGWTLTKERQAWCICR